MAQWLGLHVSHQGTQVRSLVRELDPACHNEDQKPCAAKREKRTLASAQIDKPGGGLA